MESSNHNVQHNAPFSSNSYFDPNWLDQSFPNGQEQSLDPNWNHHTDDFAVPRSQSAANWHGNPYAHPASNNDTFMPHEGMNADPPYPQDAAQYGNYDHHGDFDPYPQSVVDPSLTGDASYHADNYRDDVQTPDRPNATPPRPNGTIAPGALENRPSAFRNDSMFNDYAYQVQMKSKFNHRILTPPQSFDRTIPVVQPPALVSNHQAHWDMPQGRYEGRFYVTDPSLLSTETKSRSICPYLNVGRVTEEVGITKCKLRCEYIALQS